MSELDTEGGSTANQYEILAKLAAGGMAEIFLARTQSQAGVERHVVLKRVLGHREADIKHVHMFLDEARLAAQLQHPNIAQVFDTGKLGNSYFFTMEYVHGETVRELMHRAYELKQQVPLGCVLTIIAGAAAGLQHAHDRVGVDGKPLGIVHRDVSPSNLMVSYEGNIKVVDFGVAKAADRSVQTQTGTVKGKIGYMAPEQCRGGVVDRRCDLFTLGIVMWEILVGARLYKRATDFESMEAIDVEPAVAPSTLRPEIPKELDELVLTLLEKAPEDRYQTADEFLEELEKVALKTGIVMSVPALRRFVGELFGVRPEPWLELRRAGNERSETVTMTGTPIDDRVEEVSLNTQLQRLRDLSIPHRDVMPARPSTPRPARRPGSPAAAAIAEKHKTTAIRGVERARRRWALGIVTATAVLAIGTVTVYLGRRSSPSTGVITVNTPPGTHALVVPTPDAREAAVEPAAVDAGAAIAVDAAVPPEPVADIEGLWRAQRYSEIVAACDASSRLVADHAESCVLAACREHRTELARQLFPHVRTSRRRSTVASCKKLGTRLSLSIPHVRPTTPDPGSPDPTKPGPDPTKPDPTKPDPGKPTCDDPDPMACRQ